MPGNSPHSYLDLSYTPPPREPTQTSVLSSILSIEGGVVKKYFNVPPYNDEPKFYYLTAQLALSDDIRKFAERVGEGESLGTAGGASLNKSRALWKAAGEAVERYCLLPSDSPSVYGSFTSFGEGDAVDPNHICAGASLLKPDRRSLNLRWMSGTYINESRPVWVPSQLVFVPHIFHEGEAILRAPITTGAAAGFSLEDAVYRGLCEVIERDAFMVAWLRQLRLPRLDLGSYQFEGPDGESLQQLLEASLRYRIEPLLFLLPTGTPVPTVLCTLCDSSGVGPSVTVGAKTSWSLTTAMVGAVEEAYQIRPWMRRLLKDEGTADKLKGSEDRLPRTLKDRAILWLSGDSVRHLSGWLEGCREAPGSPALPSHHRSPSLADLVQAVTLQGGTVYYVDLSDNIPTPLKNSGIKVVKVIVPEYQPLYLTEELKDFAWGRLTTAEARLGVEALRTSDDLMTFPHPFL